LAKKIGAIGNLEGGKMRAALTYIERAFHMQVNPWTNFIKRGKIQF